MPQHQTVGRDYNAGKIAHVVCAPNDKLGDITIQNDCFLLLIITEGSASFRVGINHVIAQAPCFVCFDETENPILLSKKKLRCRAIYFHPQFLNINMSFELIRTGFYGDIAHTHDMFLLRPFLEHHYVVPIAAPYLDKVTSLFDEMHAELLDQRDWYWSCRGRSYFMEIVISLERLYGLMERGKRTVETSFDVYREPFRGSINTWRYCSGCRKQSYHTNRAFCAGAWSIPYGISLALPDRYSKKASCLYRNTTKGHCQSLRF